MAKNICVTGVKISPRLIGGYSYNLIGSPCGGILLQKVGVIPDSGCFPPKCVYFTYPMTHPWDERYICLDLPSKLTIHVGKYTIHGCYGYGKGTSSSELHFEGASSYIVSFGRYHDLFFSPAVSKSASKMP